MKNIIAAFSLLALIVTLYPSSSPAGTLAVPVIYQQQNQWCWAASCQMILSYYGYSSSQCAMANWCFSQSNCCINLVWNPNAPITPCNQPNWIYGYSRDMQDVLIHWGPIYSTGVGTYLAWSTVQSESNAGRPFVIGFSWKPLPNSGGHAMVGRGYLGTNVYYNDPWPGEGYMCASYNWMRSSSNHVWDQSLRLTTSPVSSSTRAPLQVFAGDFSGNGTSQIAIFRPSSGLWSIRNYANYYFGRSGDIPVPGDYNNNGRSDIAIFRPSTGLWAIRNVGNYYFGRSGDIPVPADYNGNGRIDIAIFRPSTGLWAIRNVGNYYFGRSGDSPVPGDYNNNGRADIAIFRPSSGLWSIRNYANYYYGRSGDNPVPMNRLSGNYVVPAIFRPSTGLWSVRGQYYTYYGRSGDVPVPGRWTGSANPDRYAIFRPSTGLWSIWNVGSYYFGKSGDIPVTR